MNFGIRITVGISVAAPSGGNDSIPANALTLGGETITLGGQTITLDTP